MKGFHLYHLKLSGFRSFVEPVFLDLSGSKGMVRISGENLVDGDLQANGVGKSTLFEGIYWVLFGTTSFGEKGPSLRNWDAQEEVVGEVRFVMGSWGYTLCRTQSPNSLELRKGLEPPRPIDQEALEKEIGVTPQLFRHAVFLSQFGESFVDLGPTEQLAVYSDLLNLQVWDEAKARAGEHGSFLKKELEKNRVQLSGMLGEWRAYAILEEKREWEEHRKTIAAYHELKTLGLSLKLAKVEETELQSSVPPPPSETKGLDKKLVAEQAELKKLETKKQDLQNNQNREQNKADAASNKKTCSLCGQPLKGEALAAVQKQQKSALKNVSALGDAIQHVEDAIAAKNVILGGLLRRSAEESEQLKRYVRENSAMLRDLADARSKVLALEEKIQDRVSRFPDTREKELPERWQGLKDRIASTREQIKEQEGLLVSAQMWEKLFKEVKLSVIEESLAQLALHASAILEDLGMVGWEVSVDAAKETKSGTVKHGFSLLIARPEGDPLPLRAYSGGEQQRARLAVQLALSLVIRQRSTNFNLLFLDEPTTHLSASGISALLDVLKEMSDECEVWIADHRALDMTTFNKSYLVRKDETGSKLTLMGR